MYQNRDQNPSNGGGAEQRSQSADSDDDGTIDVRESRDRTELDQSIERTSVDDGADPERNRRYRLTPELFFERIVRLGRTTAKPVEIVFERTRSTGDDGPETPRAGSAELLAPFIVSVVYVGLAALLGPGVFDTAASGFTQLGAYVLLGTLLHLSGYSTLQLYSDSRLLQDGDGRWQPNPWLYICGGALALVGVRAGEILIAGRTVSEPTIYFVGNAFVALPLASIVAGPIYWSNRRRHGESTE
ncbi:hypothetical protein [Natrinema halophilum]|uniref:Uncharacterized protein n=1 Tax=Natrinema halophilum TaxID=1699371 RepID=A0A7D5GGI0_9EURY|nr:hypothetical protein [Natrinema halophilum]QLG48308.1 hypothetical protein HYG82_05310 [Natrinema halophilum]